jgi:hypothetical protein
MIFIQLRVNHAQNFSIAAGVFASTAAALAADPTVLSEQRKLIRTPTAIGVLSPDLFGDRVNFRDGGLEFVHEDVSIPGNNRLPVSMGRRHAVSGHRY